MSADASVLLDVDGTLVDSNYAHVDAWSHAFAAEGHVVPAWEIHRAIGMGSDKLVAKLVGSQVAEEIGEAISEHHDSLFEGMIGDVRALPGARDLLNSLKQRGYTTVLASSAQSGEVEHYIGLLDARELIDAWTTSDDVDRTKPDARPDRGRCRTSRRQAARDDRRLGVGLSRRCPRRLADARAALGRHFCHRAAGCRCTQCPSRCC